MRIVDIVLVFVGDIVDIDRIDFVAGIVEDFVASVAVADIEAGNFPFAEIEIDSFVVVD